MKHAIIPDAQTKKGVSLKHFTWIGKYLAQIQPEKIISLGDWYDLPSLSQYDEKTQPEEHYSRRYSDDIDAGDKALDLLMNEVTRVKGYAPSFTITKGNHEYRWDRHLDAVPHDKGTKRDPLGYMAERGWNVIPFLKPVKIDGILYCHYFCRGPNGMVTNLKHGMSSAKIQVTREMISCTAGHKQGLDVHVQPTGNGMKWGIIAGSCYMHEEKYLGPQGTNYWRGILIKTEVRNGEYNLMQVSLDYLKRKFA